MRHILHIFGRMSRGGAELRTLELMRHIDRNRFQFSFCALSGLSGSLDDEIRYLGGEVYLCGFGLTFPQRFRQLLREGQFDAAHSHIHYSSGFILRLAAKENIPIRIAHFRSIQDGHGLSLRRRLQRKIMRHWINLYATDILAVSNGAMKASWGAKWRDDPRCQVIYNGISLTPFQQHVDRTDVLDELGIPTGSLVYIHVGRMDPVKNHDRLVTIFQEIARQQPTAYLLMVGRDNTKTGRRIRMKIADLSIAERIIIVGERDDVPRLLQVADLLIFPSLWEGLPGAILEACAAGVPVLASDPPGIVEIAGHLPLVHYLPLGADDTIWAKAAQYLTRQTFNVESAQQLFQESPFNINNFVRRSIEIW